LASSPADLAEWPVVATAVDGCNAACCASWVATIREPSFVPTDAAKLVDPTSPWALAELVGTIAIKPKIKALIEIFEIILNFLLSLFTGVIRPY
jgi:hypothetical protein